MDVAALREDKTLAELASGADLYTVAKILGHSRIKTTERYAHHQESAQRAALDKAFTPVAPAGELARKAA